MSATGKTTNYDFPIYNPNDTLSFLGSYNQTMQDIDTTCKSISIAAEEAKTIATGSHDQIDALQQSVVNLNNSITSINQSLINVNNQFTFNSYNNNISVSTVGGNTLLMMVVSNNISIASVSVVFNITSTPPKLYVDVDGSASNLCLIGQINSNVFALNAGGIITKDSNNLPNNVTNAGLVNLAIGQGIGTDNAQQVTHYSTCTIQANYDGTTTWIYLSSPIIRSTGYASKEYVASRTYLKTGKIINI